ncbi:FAD-binding oxidoreductase [Williamsia deligens]
MSPASLPAPPMRWDGWGDPDRETVLSESVLALIRGALGVSGTPTPRRSLTDVEVAPTRLTDDDIAGLVERVGDGHVSVGGTDRLLRAAGRSTPDLLRRRAHIQAAPDAVVLPGSTEEVAAVLAWCADADIAVVTYGGGTAVTGGLTPIAGDHRAVISLDLRRLDGLAEVDDLSRIAVLGAGVTGPRAEELLGQHGLSLGHFPQSFRFATIGGFAATRSSGQASAGYGRFDEMVVGLTLATPRGVLRLRPVEHSAAGPDLRQVVLGSEGTFGVITEVAVRVHPVPPTAASQAWRFPDFATGAAAVRAAARSDARPTVLRMSDEAETAVNLAAPGAIGADAADAPGGCLVITRFEGEEDDCLDRRRRIAAILSDAGGVDLGSDPADTWAHGRFDAPYLRDALLAIGVGCETLETATTWSGIEALRTAVADALSNTLGTDTPDRPGSPALVLCHISHTYPTAASLYFTVVYRLADRDPVAQWMQAKEAASRAIVAHGATITHHHAVGTDHRDHLDAEIGDLGVEILRAVKNALDPSGVMNPGKLIP